MRALRIAPLWAATCGNPAPVLAGSGRGCGFGGVSVPGRGLAVAANCRRPSGCSLQSTPKAYSTTLALGDTSYVVRSRFKLEELPDCNFAWKVMQSWPSFGNKPAILEAGTDRVYTYAQLSDAVRRVSSALRKMGFKPNDVLCVSNTNNSEYPIVYFSTMAIGGIANPVNPAYTKIDGGRYTTVSKNRHVVHQVWRSLALQLQFLLVAVQSTRDSAIATPDNCLCAQPWAIGMDGRYQGFRNESMMADCCWILYRDIPDTVYTRKAYPKHF